MSTETRPTPAADNAEAPAVAAGQRPAESASIPEKWKPLLRELTTYHRHLPALLNAGDAGRFVVIKGDELCKVWDTYPDANQYGIERFGDEPFMVQRVDPKDVERLARFFPRPEGVCPG
jgi:hypothetical protein